MTQNTSSRKRLFSNRFLWVGGILFFLLTILACAFYYFFLSASGIRWRALYNGVKFPEGYEIHGFDVSHYQGNIDWDKVRTGLLDGCPIRFVMIKATEGSTEIDNRFNYNFYQAREHGFIRGAYHFWSNRSSAKEQAQHFMNNVQLLEGDLPPVLDIERIPNDVVIEDFQREILTWLHMLEDKYDTKPIIYTYYKFRQKYLNKPVFDDYPFWIAHYYVDEMKYKGKWKFWQHTDLGYIPGINGYIDLNIYNGSYYDLQMLTLR